MSENQTHKLSVEHPDQFDGNAESKNLTTESTPTSLSRRSFLGRVPPPLSLPQVSAYRLCY